MLLATFTAASSFAASVGTAFTYQGRLLDSGDAANGSYDLQFSLFDEAAAGVQVGPTLTNAAVEVTNGLFAVVLDFGPDAFTTGARWLEVAVQTDKGGSLTVLKPRQRINSTPYALDAASADAVPATHITGTLSDAQLPAVVPRLDANQTFTGTVQFKSGVGNFGGNGTGLTNLSTTNLVGSLADALLSANVPLLTANQIFTGSNTFAGVVVLSNAANSFAGRFAGDGSGLTNLAGKVAVLTTNSTFAAIRAGFAAGGSIWFQPGDYYSISNLFLTSNTTIFGWGAVLHAAPGITNFLIDESMVIRNVSIYGLGVTGDWFADYSAPGFLTPDPWPDPHWETGLINQHGMRLNMGGGGTIAGCSACGFGGYGFMLISPDAYEGESKLRGFFHDNHSYSNAVGVGVIGPAYDYPGYPGAPPETWVLATDEHQLFSGNEMFKNSIGLFASAGNCLILGNKITANNYGVLLTAGPNDTHGEIIGNTLNHNNVALYISCSIGEIVRNNLMLDINSVIFDSAGYLVLDGNHLCGDGGPLTITLSNQAASRPSLVTISRNTYMGSWGTDLLLQTNLLTRPAAVYVYGNHSVSVAGDTDRSAVSLIENGMGMTTNCVLPGGATLCITNGMIMSVK